MFFSSAPLQKNIVFYDLLNMFFRMCPYATTFLMRSRGIYMQIYIIL